MNAFQANRNLVRDRGSSATPRSEGWLTGYQGSMKLQFLTARLFWKIRDAAIRDHGVSIPDYLPWLSCRERSAKLGVFAINQSQGQILTDALVLRKLRRAYWMDRSAPLGQLSIKSDCMSIDVRASERDLTVLQRAIDLVVTADGSWDERFAALVRMIVPLKTIGKNVRRGGVGFSSEYAKGAIFLSIPRQAEHADVELSINLAHEMGHQALMVYQASDQIIEGNLGLPVYSGVRKTNRPAIQSFHAMIALAFMVEYVNDRLTQDRLRRSDAFVYLERRGEELIADFEVAIEAFKGVVLTPIGQKLYAECRELLRSVKPGEVR